jgi:hypothetical protein
MRDAGRSAAERLVGSFGSSVMSILSAVELGEEIDLEPVIDEVKNYLKSLVEIHGESQQ